MMQAGLSTSKIVQDSLWQGVWSHLLLLLLTTSQDGPGLEILVFDTGGQPLAPRPFMSVVLHSLGLMGTASQVSGLVKSHGVAITQGCKCWIVIISRKRTTAVSARSGSRSLKAAFVFAFSTTTIPTFRNFTARRGAGRVCFRTGKRCLYGALGG